MLMVISIYIYIYTHTSNLGQLRVNAVYYDGPFFRPPQKLKLTTSLQTSLMHKCRITTLFHRGKRGRFAIKAPFKHS